MRNRINSCSGQSLLEFAVMIPLMFLLVVNVVNFGGLLYACITVSSAARSGASYMTLGPATVNGPTLPLLATVRSLVNADLSSLPNAATVNICTNNNGTVSCPMPTNPSTGAAYVDPEPSTSVLGSVQVTYRYCPIIPAWDFSALGVHSTLPACSFTSQGVASGGGTQITRVAVMRVLQ